MWIDERVNASRSTNFTAYSLCCKEGMIKLPPMRETPSFLETLFDGHHNFKGMRFQDKIRVHNSMFQFTSIGGKVDGTINTAPGPYVFKMSGQNYHRLGFLIPIVGQRPKFAQL